MQSKKWVCSRCLGERFISYVIGSVYQSLKKGGISALNFPCPICNAGFKDGHADYVKDYGNSRWKPVLKLTFDGIIIKKYNSLASCIKDHAGMTSQYLAEYIDGSMSGVYCTKFGGKFKLANEPGDFDE